MALQFTDDSTDQINHGSGSTLDNLVPATILMWVKPSVISVGFRSILSKTSGGSGWALYSHEFNDFWAFDISGTVYNRVFFDDVMTTDWQSIAITWERDVIAPAAYRGTLTTALSDITNTSSTGSGGFDDSAATLFTGTNFDGNTIGMSLALLMIWNRILTIGELEAQRWRPHKNNGCVFFAHYGFNGTGTQPDWSGNGNSGTVTGATVSPHVPLGPPFGFSNTILSILAGGFTPKITRNHPARNVLLRM